MNWTFFDFPAFNFSKILCLVGVLAVSLQGGDKERNLNEEWSLKRKGIHSTKAQFQIWGDYHVYCMPFERLFSTTNSLNEVLNNIYVLFNCI